MSERSQNSTPSVLEARGLGFQYQPNWWCLKEIDLAVRTGECVGVVGANGAGKSTMLYTLCGQLRPSAGEVMLDGRPVARYARRELARHVGVLPQTVESAFEFTCEEIVGQGRYPHQGAVGLLDERDREVIQRAMAWTHTEAFARRTLHELSGGERQRVLLASVLAQETDFLLLDEPTSALDITHQVDVFRRLRALAGQGMGVLVITHDLNLAARYCHRLYMLFEGRIVATGSPEEVMRTDILKEVYQTDLIVDRNPVTGAPMVVLLGDDVQDATSDGSNPNATEGTPWHS